MEKLPIEDISVHERTMEDIVSEIFKINMFDFKITAKCNNARNSIFTTPHGEIHTPVFMPVGTKATVKSLDYKDLESLNTEIILSNTYHLEMRRVQTLFKKWEAYTNG